MNKTDIIAILRNTPLLKGKEIAKKLGKDRGEVNAFLHRNGDVFVQDKEYRWAVKEVTQVRVGNAPVSWTVS